MSLFQSIYDKAFQLQFLSFSEALDIYKNAPLGELMNVAHNIRLKLHPTDEVTWLIDRNINITNVCVSQCGFCNFCRKPKDSDTYITSMDEYTQKIDEMLLLGGEQLLLQGGLHPDLGLDFYKDLFKNLKNKYPQLKLHALGPPEIVYLAKKENIPTLDVLKQLIESGLNSLPGAGAEILSDRVRKIVSPAKASSQEWLDVMKEAHQLGLVTSATMMFGHVETLEERIEHIFKIRDTQALKPHAAPGFLAFIPWPIMADGTVLQKRGLIQQKITSEEYLRMVAISRILLPNVQHIQASWLTVGVPIGQLCLHAGADDFGSVMIEENVVASAGVALNMNIAQMKKAIIDGGFKPIQRNQLYNPVNE